MELLKKENRIPLESIILFFVLFFPGIYASGFSARPDTIETIPFSMMRELGRTVTYSIPSLALLWYLASDKMPLKKKCLFSLKRKPLLRRDFFVFGTGLAGLIFIGVSISILVSIVSQAYGLPLPPRVEAPGNILGWIVMIFACLGTGYLEESYFRYYLLTKLRKALPNTTVRVFFSTFLFAICHMYEGPWGVLNAALAGIFLSVLFIRYRSFHGITWAHAAYNMFVYTMGVFTS